MVLPDETLTTAEMVCAAKSDCHLHQKKAFHIWQGAHTRMLMHVAMETLKGHNIRPEIQCRNKEKAAHQMLICCMKCFIIIVICTLFIPTAYKVP